MCVYRPKRQGSGSEDSSSQSSCVADDQQLLLQNSTNSDEHASGVSGNDPRTLNSVQQDRECTSLADIELQHFEKREDATPIAVEMRGHSQHREECEDELSGGVDDTREREMEALDQRQSGKRKGSLVPFYNRRSSFTPSFYKPARLFPHKRPAGTGPSSVHQSCQGLLFEEEEGKKDETLSLPQQKTGEPADTATLEKGRRYLEDGEAEMEEEEGEKEGDMGEERATTRLSRLCETLKKSLRNLKLFLT